MFLTLFVFASKIFFRIEKSQELEQLSEKDILADVLALFFKPFSIVYTSL